MAYVPPTVEGFRARYPEFSAVSNATVEAMLAETALDVGESWIEADRAAAQMALAAHWLVGQGALGGVVSSGGGSVQVAGPVTRVKVGDVETSFGNASGSGSSGSSGGSGDLSSTAYGLRFLQLRRRSFPAIAVV